MLKILVLAGALQASRAAAPSPTPLGQAFTSILEDVRVRHGLRYDPVTTPAQGWHKLEVRLVSGRKERLRARSGYWVR